MKPKETANWQKAREFYIAKWKKKLNDDNDDDFKNNNKSEMYKQTKAQTTKAQTNQTNNTYVMIFQTYYVHKVSTWPQT